MRGWIPTEIVMKRKGIVLASRCFCCREHGEETLEHLFLKGEVAEKVWKHFSLVFTVNFDIAGSQTCYAIYKKWINVG